MKKKKILRIISIGMLSVFGILGLAIGIFALSGGLREKVVQATSLYRNEQAFASTGNIVHAGSKVDSDGNVQELHIIIEDDITITLGSMPENSTTNTLTVSKRQDHHAISLPDVVKTREPFTIKVLKDADGRNIGGSAVIQFISTVGMSCKLHVIVDTPTTSNSLSYDTSNLPDIKVPVSETETGGEKLFIVARDEIKKTIELSSSYFNAFNINQSNISFLGPTVKRDVLFFTEQSNIITTELVTDERPEPFYKLTMNLQNVQGNRFSVLTRMHRTYQMQEEFKAKGFLSFFDLYYGKPTAINDDATYQALVVEYNKFLNKYYNYINDTRSVSEFFTQFQRSGNEISLRYEQDSFLTQVWPSLKHVMIVADIEFFISDVEITGLNVEDTEHEFIVFDNTQFTLKQLVDKFNIETKLGDGEAAQEDEATTLALLSNLSVSVFIDEGEIEDGEMLPGISTSEHLQSIYQLSKVINANENTIISPQTESRLRLNDNYLEINKTAGVYNFLPKIPSKEKPFQIYVLFALSITKSSGETNVFYDFGKIFINYTSPASIIYEGNDASNLVERKPGENSWDMCVDNNGLVAANPDIFDGAVAIGSQDIIINTNKIINKSQIQQQYLIPRLFIEYNSNNGVRGAMQVYLDGRLHSLDEQNFNIIKVDGRLANFITLDGMQINYGNDLLTGYEIPLTNLNDGRFSANIQAINSSNDVVKFFVVFVLTDANSHPIDREGNRLFNDNGDAIDVDGELIVDAPVNYVVLYSTLVEGDASVDILSELKFSSFSLLEKINYFTEVGLGETNSFPHSYLYEEKDLITGKITVKEAPTYSLFLRNNRTDGSIDLTYTKLRLLTNEEYEKLIYVSGYKINRRFNSQGLYELYIDLNSKEIEQINNGIDVIGNIKRAFDSAINKMGNEKLDFVVNSDSVNISLSNTQATVDATQIYDVKTSPIEPSEPAVLMVKSGYEKNYKLLAHDNLTIIVNSPEVSNITRVNDDIFNGTKNIIMSGQFDKGGSYGDIVWQFFTDKQSGLTRYSFYYGNGIYKTRLIIDSADTNMLHLYQEYINEVEAAKSKIDFDEDLISGKTYEQDLAEIVNIVNDEIIKYNAANKTSHPLVKISFSDEENVADASISNESYIIRYLGELISKAAMIDFNEWEEGSDLTYNVDRLLTIIQNYGIVPSTTKKRSDDELAYLIDIVKNAYYGTFPNYISEITSVFEESSFDAVFAEYHGEVERKNRVVRAVSYLLYKVPQYDNNILKVWARVDGVKTFDFNEVESKMKTIVETMYGEVLNYQPTDNYYRKIEQILLYINKKDGYGEAQTIDDIVAFINDHLGAATLELTDDIHVGKYFTAGRYNPVTKEVLLNDDGTIPFELGDFGDFVINIDLVASLFQQSDGSYTLNVPKRYAFYAQFEKINTFEIKNADGEINSASNPLIVNGGKELNISQFIYVNDIRYTFMNHMYIEIPKAHRTLANFGMADGQYIYAVYGGPQTNIYLNNVENIDEHISLEITMPYLVNGVQLKKNMYIQIAHNFKYTATPASQLIGSDDGSEIAYDINKLTENFNVKELIGTNYTDIAVTYELELVGGNNDFVRMQNNTLYVKNIYKTIAVQVKVTVYRSSDLLFEFLEPVVFTVQPLYRVQINSTKVGEHYFENETLYNNTNLLENLFTFYKFNVDEDKYEVVTDIHEVQHIISLSIDISETMPVEYWENRVGAEKIKEQFFVKNEDDELVATNLYNLLYDGTIDASGKLMLPELAKTVILPVVAKFNGYFDGQFNQIDKTYNLYLFIKVGGITKWQSDNGEINVEYDESQNFSLPATEDGYKQTFQPIELVVSSDGEITYNLNSYFALILGNDFATQYKFLNLSFEIVSESLAGVSMQTNQITIVGGEVEDFSNTIYLNGVEIENESSSITLKITAYEFVGVGIDNLEYKKVEYSDNTVQITITKQ